MAAPMPRPPPVTTAGRPASDSRSVSGAFGVVGDERRRCPPARRLRSPMCGLQIMIVHYVTPHGRTRSNRTRRPARRRRSAGGDGDLPGDALAACRSGTARADRPGAVGGDARAEPRQHPGLGLRRRRRPRRQGQDRRRRARGDDRPRRRAAATRPHDSPHARRDHPPDRHVRSGAGGRVRVRRGELPAGSGRTRR